MAESMSEIMNPSTARTDPNYPHAPADWSRRSAEETATAEGIALSPLHWEVVGTLQDYFSREERPNMRRLHDALEERFHADGGMKRLYELFPGGPVAQGCRIAGIEPPAGSADMSFGSVQ